MPSLGNGTYHPSHITYWDKSKEKGTFKVYGVVVTATYSDPNVVNFTAQSGFWAALVAAANALVRGTIYAALWVNEVISNAEPTQDSIDQQAARETKLLIQYIDNTSQKRLIATLPTLDLSLVTYLPQAGDFVAITADQGAGTEVTDFVSAFEDYVVNPQTGNPVTIVGLKVVGRSN
jgi:hypothetical protein